MKKLALIILSMIVSSTIAQKSMAPEQLWQLGRVSALGISKDSKSIIIKYPNPIWPKTN